MSQHSSPIADSRTNTDAPPRAQIRHYDERLGTEAARRAWKNWLILVSTLIVSLLVLLTITFPTAAGSYAQFWPWRHTDTVLRLGLFAMIALPVLRLSKQTRESLWFRTRYVQLESEVERQVLTEEQLLFENETLEQRVAQRTAELEERTRALQLANDKLEEKNVRLKDLNNSAHQFVNNVSHEFRTPLTVIKEYAATLQEALADNLDPDVRGFFDVIDNRVEDLNVMVNDLLDISRLEADIMRMSRRTIHPQEIVQRVQLTLERKAARNGVSFEVRLAQAVPAVFCDPEKIGRVIINLGVNAMKFVNPGGHVNLWVRQEDETGDVHFGVTDDGPGIPADQLEVVFERFNQLRSAARASTNGFGLGLSIARELVFLNLGDLHVQSSPGAGSVFWFSVPPADPCLVLGRYLERVREFAKPLAEVSLVRIVPRPAPAGPSRHDLRFFLENQLRRSDILFEARDGAWILVAATHHDGVFELLDRLAKEHERANQTRPLQPILGFEPHYLGTWSPDTQRFDLVRAFRAVLGTRAPDRAFQ